MNTLPCGDVDRQDAATENLTNNSSLSAIIEEALTYHSIHHDNKNFFAIGQKIHHTSKVWIQKLYPVANLVEILTNIDKSRNCYISQGEFGTGENRTEENLAALPGEWMDLDYYKIAHLADKSGEEILQMCLERCVELNYPFPTHANDSGQGLQVKWISPEPILKSDKLAFRKWKILMSKIVDEFSFLGADPVSTDSVRVLRLVDTTNTNNGAICKTIFKSGMKYDLDYMFNAFHCCLDEPESAPIQKPKKTSGVASKKRTKPIVVDNCVNTLTWTERRLALDRSRDLETLMELRYGAGGVKVGERDKFLLLLTTFLSLHSPPETLAQEVMDIYYKIFCPSAPRQEARSWLASIVKRAVAASKGEKYINPENGKLCDPRYRYTNAKLKRFLVITDEEEMHLKTIISKKEKKRRRAEKKFKSDRLSFLAKAKAKKEATIAEVVRLYNDGFCAKEISVMLGLKQRWIQQILSVSF